MNKRFDYTNYDDGTESIYDRKEDEYYFDCDFCKLDEVLNELAEENEELKRDRLENYKAYKKLLNENEELKEAMKRMMIDMMDGG